MHHIPDTSSPARRSLTSLLSLQGRVALVTGAGRGIGRAIALRLAEAGAAVAVADRERDYADAVAHAIRDDGGAAHAIEVDVAHEAEINAMVHTCCDTLGGLDVMVNNAGIFPACPLLATDAALFDRVLAVNLRGVFLGTQAAARAMVARHRPGVVITITSIDALHPSSAGLAHYDASKHGAWGLTQAMALELAPHNIRVNAVAPGGVLTPGVEEAVGGADAVLDAFRARVPMERMGDPDEIARVVLFLASDLATYMTGAHVVVDGGRLLT